MKKNNWTYKMENLEVGQVFFAERGNYISLNSTRQRFKSKFPERIYSIISGGNLSNGLITVKRIK